MLVHRRDRPFRAALAARLSAVCALAVALVPALAAPASAYQPCPTEPNPAAEIYNFDTTWPRPGRNPHGVTMCLVHSEQPLGYVQIVDLRDGAAIELRSHRIWDLDSYLNNTTWMYQKKTVEDWHLYQDSIVNPYPRPAPPDPGLGDYLSTTNAAFFIDDDNDRNTQLPMPLKTDGGEYRTWGMALLREDIAWEQPKKKLVLSRHPHTTTPPAYPNQRVEIGDFPTYYTGADADAAFSHTIGVYSGLVSYPADHRVPTTEVEARRTMLGVDEALGRVYILTTYQPITLERGQLILRHFGSTEEIQLDGGRSTSMFSYFGEVPPFSIPGVYPERKVPQYIMVRLSESM